MPRICSSLHTLCLDRVCRAAPPTVHAGQHPIAGRRGSTHLRKHTNTHVQREREQNTQSQTSGTQQDAHLSRSPAVSLKITGTPPSAKRTSITSRVVPAIGDTIAAGRLARRFNSELFPALGGPTSTALTPCRTISPTCTVTTRARQCCALPGQGSACQGRVAAVALGLEDRKQQDVQLDCQHERGLLRAGWRALPSLAAARGRAA
eukprot:1091148-Rhodomonas_salina.1